jgi:hypothetical protein
MFKAFQAQADQAVHTVNELHITLMKCKVCNKALQQMVLLIYNAMDSETKVPALSQEITDIITQASQDMNEQDTENKDVDMHGQ